MRRKYEVIAYTTISLDGGLGFKERRTVLSSDNDFHRLHYLRSISQAIVVGANTVLTDNPLLTVRLKGYSGRQPYRVVIDGSLRTSPEYRVFDTKIAPSILVTSEENKFRETIELFRKRGVIIVFTKKKGKLLNLRKAFEEISDRFNVKRFLVEGGGFLLGSLIKENLVDKLIVSITPKLLGLRKVDYINIELEEVVKLKLEQVSIDINTGEIVLTYTFARE